MPKGVQVQVLSSALIIMPDYSGFFLLRSSIPALVPCDVAQKVQFVSMPIDRKPQVSPAAFFIIVVSVKI